MNKLRGSRVYCAGPMDRVKDGGVGWRRMITPALKNMGIYVLDPTNKPIDIGCEDIENREFRSKLKQNLEFDKIRKMGGEIRRVDLRSVDVVDALVVHWDTTVSICGTMEEITLANRQKKPILIKFSPDIQSAPDWLFFMLPHKYFFDTWEDLLKCLYRVDSGEEVDDRWVLFDWESLK